MYGTGVLTYTSRGGRSASVRLATRLSLEHGEVPVLGSSKVKIASKAVRAVSLRDATSAPASMTWCAASIHLVLVPGVAACGGGGGVGSLDRYSMRSSCASGLELEVRDGG